METETNSLGVWNGNLLWAGGMLLTRIGDIYHYSYVTDI